MLKTLPVVIATARYEAGSNPAQRLRCEKRYEAEGGIILESLVYRT